MHSPQVILFSVSRLEHCTTYLTGQEEVKVSRFYVLSEISSLGGSLATVEALPHICSFLPRQRCHLIIYGCKETL